MVVVPRDQTSAPTDLLRTIDCVSVTFGSPTGIQIGVACGGAVPDHGMTLPPRCRPGAISNLLGAVAATGNGTGKAAGG